MPQNPTWLRPFSPTFRAGILEALRAPVSGRRLACFDADGTLWSEDIGEAFLRWMIASGRIEKKPGALEIYQEYEQRVHQDRALGYAWAVQIMAGHREQDLLTWSSWLAHAWPNYRPAMRGLVQGLEEAGIEVWIVSASNRWTIRAAAPFMGFNPDRTMGISVEVENELLTERITRPIVCMEGKVQAIRARLGTDPLLAFGDSLGDLAMLEHSSFPMVVGRKDQKGASLLGIAKERSWAVHLF